MANCEVKSPPVFSDEVRKWDRNTDADGDAMGADVEKVFNNTIYNKAMIEKVVGKKLKKITIPMAGWSGLAYTIEDSSIMADSTVYIGYAFDSIPAAQKANIRGRTEAGKLVLVAKKQPEQEIVIDELRIINS